MLPHAHDCSLSFRAQEHRPINLFRNRESNSYASKPSVKQQSGEAEQPIIGKSVFAILFVITSERKLNKTLGEKAQDIHEYDYEDTHALRHA